ncbi:hypothetical protein BMF94_1078 [Rhodotorula taiwanensis]|uniref:F-box domain-containing protein n=1 Tax=Rhodotorula taiwanensis TaxID=741276 RepID=A0A2S5BGW8_9BASI|nr:hypothetical protein BMF94_1078 [Rhodotorula taiwanensis]
MVAASTLLSLSLVSQTWSRAAQAALHADPFLCFDAPDTIPPRTYERLSMLLRTLAARPDLARSVRCLDLGLYTTRCQTEARVDRRRVSQLSIDLVRAAPALHALSLPFVTQADKPHLVDALRSLDCLQTLTIGEGTSSPDPWVINVDIGIKDQWGCARWFRGDFVPLCRHWPRLRKVNLQARLRNRDKDDVVGVPWRLEAFELSLHRHGRLGFAQLDLLLHGCRAATLRHLHVKEHQLAEGALENILSTYGSGLTSLTTLTADHFSHHNALFPTIAESCPALETLYLATPVYDLLANLRDLLRLPRLRELTLATAVAPVVPPVDLVARLAEVIGSGPSLSAIAIAPGTHHVIDRMNTIYFTRALAETSKALHRGDGTGWIRLAVLPSWGPV